MFKASVRCAGEDKVGRAELFQAPEALEFGSIDDLLREWGARDRFMHAVENFHASCVKKRHLSYFYLPTREPHSSRSL